MPYVLNTEDITKTLYEQNRNYLGQQTWRDAFLQTSMAEQKALSEVQYDYSTAINEAYNAAMLNQNSIYGTALGSGYKQRLIEQNMKDLYSAFDEYKSNYLKNKSSIVNSYDELQSGISSTLRSEAQNVIDYANAHYGYIEKLYEKSPELFEKDMELSKLLYEDENSVKLLKSRSNLMDDMYDEKGNLTEYGKSFYDFVENNEISSGYSFSDYLYETNKELLDWATSSGYDYNILDNTNAGMFRELTGRDRLDFKTGGLGTDKDKNVTVDETSDVGEKFKDKNLSDIKTETVKDIYNNIQRGDSIGNVRNDLKNAIVKNYSDEGWNKVKGELKILYDEYITEPSFESDDEFVNFVRNIDIFDIKSKYVRQYVAKLQFADTLVNFNNIVSKFKPAELDEESLKEYNKLFDNEVKKSSNNELKPKNHSAVVPDKLKQNDDDWWSKTADWWAEVFRNSFTLK